MWLIEFKGDAGDLLIHAEDGKEVMKALESIDWNKARVVNLKNLVKTARTRHA